MSGAFTTSHRLVDGFLPAADAAALRADIDRHFADPGRHRPDTHQVWNYWHVPGLYTYLRTQPEKVIDRPRVEAFHAALSRWSRETLGLAQVSWPYLSLYIDGCRQGLHNDSANGRFGYVFSLTRDDRRSSGGETLLLREGDLFRTGLATAAAGAGLYDLVAPRFNRLALFDDRVPHAVTPVEGTMDPLDGRLVLHGHISEAGAFGAGPHDVPAVTAEVQRIAAAHFGGAGAADLHGPLVLRLAIGADGQATRVTPLVDRLASAAGGDAAPVVASLIAALGRTRFPAAAAASTITVPIIRGGALAAAPAPAPQPAEPDDDAGRRAATAAGVRAKLAAMPGVTALPVPTLELFIGRGFLDAAECAALIALIDAGRQPSGLLSPHPDPEFRTSESCNLSPFDPVVRRVEAKVAALTGIDPTYGETIQGQRYAPGQRFKPHHDYFHTDQPYWQTQKGIGGQRTWTLMMFLNQPEAGGHTNFPLAKVKVEPRTGNVLLWNNMDARGAPNPASLHEGMPVEAGVKYVITKWYRERIWGTQQG